jgi:hypothetical protein
MSFLPELSVLFLSRLVNRLRLLVSAMCRLPDPVMPTHPGKLVPHPRTLEE